MPLAHKLPSHRKVPRPPLHPAEKLLVALLAIQLVLLPWAFGGMYLWARIPSLILALIALALALWPRKVEVGSLSGSSDLQKGKVEVGSLSGSSDPRNSTNLQPPTSTAGWRPLQQQGPDRAAINTAPTQLLQLQLKTSTSGAAAYRLLRWPVFWLGLAFFIYVGIQMLNPAWIWQHNEKGAWWMKAIAHIDWLPHGVTGMPAKLYPPWVAALPFLSAYLCACAAWVGLTRRRAITALLTVLAINGALLAVFAIVQKLSGNGLMFWYVPPVNEFIGPFLMRNHGGAYLNLGVGIACSIAAYHFIRTQRRMLKSAPGGVFVFIALLTAVAVMASFSRGAILSLAVFALILFLAFVLRLILVKSGSTHPIIGISLASLLIAFVIFGAIQLDASGAWKRFQVLIGEGSSSFDYHERKVATAATLEMAKAEPLQGHGFGAYRFLFTTYQVKYPLLGVAEGRPTQWWQHAHNDYAEALAELGILGLVPLVGIALYAVGWLLRFRLWRHTPIWVGVLGLCMTLAHARVDFPAHLPAIAVTWCVLLVVLLRWSEIEERRG